jgi:hypothetical protein
MAHLVPIVIPIIGTGGMEVEPFVEAPSQKRGGFPVDSGHRRCRKRIPKTIFERVWW